MKKSDPTSIRTLTELRLHRQELELEILKTELTIRADLGNLREALSPVNLLRSVSKEISMVSIFTSAIALGKQLLQRKKKKKKGREEEDA